jgi:hypothetical protein
MLLVLFAASGGHWMALQSLAWTRMLVSYSRQGDLVSAVTKTFDGKHPCSLCKQVERAKSQEPQPTRVMELASSQATFVVPLRVVMVRNDGVSWRLEIPQWQGETRAQQPVTPPPQSAVA